MKKLLIIAIGLLLPSIGWSAGGGPTYPNDKIEIDWNDKAAMQRGARTFVNYCMSCHSAAYSRFNRVGADLGIPDELVRENLIFTTDVNGEKTKVGELMKTTMTPEYAEQAFGIVPPDLSLIARSRGVNWLYNYLRGFYVDDSREGIGVNNGVFANVGMPHVMADLQGLQVPKYKTLTDSHGDEQEVIVGFEVLKPGSMTISEYDKTVYELVAFLDYLAEPYKQTRKNVGTGVLIFLFAFLILAYVLKREYWKDVH
ncbi:MAG: cytochrome c1 [Gammaproteobacteria bacterium]|nr:MAG: cytochrome c1 [Gammaproteobacteria bacterium]